MDFIIYNDKRIMFYSDTALCMHKQVRHTAALMGDCL